MIGGEGILQGVGIKFVLTTSSKMCARPVLSDVYLMNLVTLGPSIDLGWPQPLSFFRAGFSSTLSWFLNFLSSSSCMNLAGLMHGNLMVQVLDVTVQIHILNICIG